jgi:hypothetical protein
MAVQWQRIIDDVRENALLEKQEAVEQERRGWEARVAASVQRAAELDAAVPVAAGVSAWEERTAMLIADAVLDEATAWKRRSAAMVDAALAAERKAHASEIASLKRAAASEAEAHTREEVRRAVAQSQQREQMDAERRVREAVEVRVCGSCWWMQCDVMMI